MLTSGKAHFIKNKEWLDSTLELCVRSGIIEKVCNNDPDLPHEAVSLGIVSWIYSSHKSLGHPVIEPDIHLAKALADHTDLSDMISRKLPQMPHSCIWFSFPEGFDVYLHETSKSDKLRVAGAYAMSSPGGESFIVYMWAPPRRGRDIGDDRFSYMPVRPGDNVDDKLYDKWSDGEVVDGQVVTVRKKLNEDERGDWKRALRMILGTLLYMNCDGAIIEAVTPDDREREFKNRHGKKSNIKKGKAGRERKALDEYGHSTILYVGSGWGKTPEGKAYRAGSEAENPEQRRRHWVRGHFRNQAHGHRLALRKTIWISPHQRGDESVSTSDVTYKVAIRER